MEKSSRRETPSIRLKCQFQSIDILPLRDYEELSKFLRDDYKSLCRMLEPNINVRVKDELSSSLMAVFNIQDVAEDILADIVVQEISSNENVSLTFRANTIPTKAMEAYIRLVGEKYLEDTLRSTLQVRHEEIEHRQTNGHWGWGSQCRHWNILKMVQYKKNPVNVFLSGYSLQGP